MIDCPIKKIIGLIGAPRSGKDTVAKYLQESRNFEVLAFADQIKQEYGINKEDFEAAKLTGEIDKLRQELWDFSSAKIKIDPLYFIRPVIQIAESSERSIIISDVRTEQEFSALFELTTNKCIKLYGVRSSILNSSKIFDGTKISMEFYDDQYLSGRRIKEIVNPNKGLFDFYKQLSKYFFMEDIMDLSDMSEPDPNNLYKRNSVLADYIQQFDVIEP